MASLQMLDVTVRDGVASRLDGVSMEIADGDFVGVVGGSGSGKTALLRAVAGLDRIESGTIRFDGRDVTRTAPAEREIAMVFQDPALIGHLSVRRNVSFPLDVRRSDVEEIRKRVDAEARAMHIEDLLVRNPRQLSHGEQQMVQIARALVRVPQLLLLDEPFAALDERLRHRMRSEIGLLQAGYGVTTLMTTNDPLDVTTLTSSLVVLDAGRLVQFGATEIVRRSPATLLAAAATGALSLVEMTVVADGTGYWLMREDPRRGELVRIRVWAPAYDAYVGSTVTVALRPEHVVVAEHGEVPAVVERRLPIPPGTVQCLVGGVQITATMQDAGDAAPGDQIRLRIDHLVAFDKVSDAAIA